MATIEVHQSGVLESGELAHMDCTHLECYYRRTLTTGGVKIFVRDPQGLKSHIVVAKPADELFKPGEVVSIDRFTDPLVITSQRYKAPASPIVPSYL